MGHKTRSRSNFLSARRTKKMVWHIRATHKQLNINDSLRNHCYRNGSVSLFWKKMVYNGHMSLLTFFSLLFWVVISSKYFFFCVCSDTKDFFGRPFLGNISSFVLVLNLRVLKSLENISNIIRTIENFKQQNPKNLIKWMFVKKFVKQRFKKLNNSSKLMNRLRCLKNQHVVVRLKHNHSNPYGRKSFQPHIFQANAPVYSDTFQCPAAFGSA